MCREVEAPLGLSHPRQRHLTAPRAQNDAMLACSCCPKLPVHVPLRAAHFYEPLTLRPRTTVPIPLMARDEVRVDAPGCLLLSSGILALREDLDAVCACTRHFEEAWRHVHGVPVFHFGAGQVDDLAGRLDHTRL